MIRLGVILVLVAACLILLSRVLKQILVLRYGQTTPSPQSAHLVQDPVCLAYLPKEGAVTAHGVYFCSAHCASQYEKGTENNG